MSEKDNSIRYMIRFRGDNPDHMKALELIKEHARNKESVIGDYVAGAILQYSENRLGCPLTGKEKELFICELVDEMENRGLLQMEKPVGK